MQSKQLIQYKKTSGMKTIFKDVAHLYLGCKLQRGGIMTCKLFNACNEAAFDAWSDIKPILRPVSDMTEEEAREMIMKSWFYSQHEISDIDVSSGYKIYFKVKYDGKGRWWRKYVSSKGELPEQFHYLLSKGFDLFNLIETKQAINKNKL